MRGKRKEAHFHYVSFSRVRSLDGLHILDLNEIKIHVSHTVKNEMFSLRSERKLNMKYDIIDDKYDDCIQISFLNAPSVHRHLLILWQTDYK